MNTNKIKSVVRASFECTNQWNLPKELDRSYAYHVRGNVLFVRWVSGEEYHRYKAVFEDMESEWYPDYPREIEVHTHNNNKEGLSELMNLDEI